MLVVRCAVGILSVIRKERPNLIIVTGAAPGRPQLSLGNCQMPNGLRRVHRKFDRAIDELT